MTVVLIVVLVFALLIASFAVFNATPVEINLQVWKTTAPLSLVILISTVAGVVLSSLLFLPKHLRGFWQVRELRAKVRRLEGELRTLHNLDNRVKQEAAASALASASHPAPGSTSEPTSCAGVPVGPSRGNEPKR